MCHECLDPLSIEHKYGSAKTVGAITRSKFVHLRYNLTTGVFIGRQEGAGTLVLGESGDEFTTDGSTALFDANGNPTGTSCSNSVGTRFKLEQ